LYPAIISAHFLCVYILLNRCIRYIYIYLHRGYLTGICTRYLLAYLEVNLLIVVPGAYLPTDKWNGPGTYLPIEVNLQIVLPYKNVGSICFQVNITNLWTLPQESFPHFLRFFSNPATWDEARDTCKTFDAELLTGRLFCCCCLGSGRHFVLNVSHIVGPLNYIRCNTKHRLPCTRYNTILLMT